MILTVTPNPALDRILFIDEFSAGTNISPQKMLDRVGGKGFDSSVALSQLGQETLALGFVAGHRGRQLVSLLEGYGIRHDLIWLEGESRLSHVIVESDHHRHSHIITGSLPITEADMEALLARCQRHLAEAAFVIAAGSLPPGAPADTYRTITELAHQAGVSLLIDSRGEAAQIVGPLQPAVLKMNWAEFNQTFAVSADSLADLQVQAQRVFEEAALPALVITCGRRGILALTSAGIYLAASPVQPAVNAAGAGDAASAGLAWRLAQGEAWPEALRWAAAIAAASVWTEGTAECRQADLDRLLAETRVDRLA